MIPSRFRIYREFAKSGIVTLVIISVLGGYCIGVSLEEQFDWLRLLETLLAVGLLASGSSALNQLQERDLDRKMERTLKRPLPSGQITVREARIVIAVWIVAGLLLLAHLGPTLLALGIAAVVLYNGLYTLVWKPKYRYAAIPGAIPGALPILIGHASARGGEIWTPAGVYLFFILFFWQMPHFWVLAIRYQDDYAKGGFPVLPVANGAPRTVFQIGVWSFAYVGLSLLAPLFLGVGLIYLVPAILTGAWILWGFSRYAKEPLGPRWLPFFLGVNFSLILYLVFAFADIRGTPWVGYFLHMQS